MNKNSNEIPVGKHGSMLFSYEQAELIKKLVKEKFDETLSSKTYIDDQEKIIRGLIEEYKKPFYKKSETWAIASAPILFFILFLVHNLIDSAIVPETLHKILLTDEALFQNLNKEDSKVRNKLVSFVKQETIEATKRYTSKPITAYQSKTIFGVTKEAIPINGMCIKQIESNPDNVDDRCYKTFSTKSMTIQFHASNEDRLKLFLSLIQLDEKAEQNKIPDRIILDNFSVSLDGECVGTISREGKCHISLPSKTTSHSIPISKILNDNPIHELTIDIDTSEQIEPDILDVSAILLVEFNQ
ncbi:MAG: hypothetical protein P8171_18925 [Candidatus Thiodiazotropha sp.]